MTVPISVGRSNLPCDPGQALEPPNQVASLTFQDDQNLNVLRHSANSQVVRLDIVTADYPLGLT